MKEQPKVEVLFAVGAVLSIGMIGIAFSGRSAHPSTKHKRPNLVTVYCLDQSVRVFHSVGEVNPVAEDCGWSFVDAATGKPTKVSGTVIIEEQ